MEESILEPTVWAFRGAESDSVLLSWSICPTFIREKEESLFLVLWGHYFMLEVYYLHTKSERQITFANYLWAKFYVWSSLSAHDEYYV
jgi:hypothetical protein